MNVGFLHYLLEMHAFPKIEISKSVHRRNTLTDLSPSNYFIFFIRSSSLNLMRNRLRTESINMRKEGTIPIVFAVIGIIFLVGAAGAYVSKVTKTSVCEACGMEIEIGDPSTWTIVCTDGVTRCGCCPICALALACYYEGATVSVPCFACGEEITIIVQGENITSVTPTTACVVFGAACVRNKGVCCKECAEDVKTSYGWAAGLPVITMEEAFSKARMMVGAGKVFPRSLGVPIITYVMIPTGTVLLVLAPLTWKIMKKTR